MVATLPDVVNASAVDALFLSADAAKGGPGGAGAQRFVRARYPNGDPEKDLMPVILPEGCVGSGFSKQEELLIPLRPPPTLQAGEL